MNEGCRRRRCGGACGASIDASDSKRFHLDLSRRSYGRFVGRTKKKDVFRPKDIFSLAAAMSEKQKRFDISRHFLPLCCAESFEFELSQQAALLLLLLLPSRRFIHFCSNGRFDDSRERQCIRGNVMATCAGTRTSDRPASRPALFAG